MGTRGTARRRFVVPWVLTWTLPAALQVVLATAFAGTGEVGSPIGLFWVVVIAANGCIVTSGAVLIRAARRNEAELGYLGLFFMTVSLLPLVHGVTTPGVLYGANSATEASVQWSVPLAVLLGSPSLLSGTRANAVATAWRAWTAVGVAIISALGCLLLVEPELLPVFAPGTVSTGLMAAVTFGACVLLSGRHLHLARVADSRLPLVVAIGYGFVGASTLMWFGAQPFSIGYWVAHLLDISGVFAGSIGALIALRSTTRVRSVVDPILAVEPLAALELGLDPTVHRFVEDLENKDPVTRDHVIRTAELAMEVGTELGLDGYKLRQVGLTGLLHDIGKLDIPDAILNKAGRLTEDEYEVMKRHAAFGQALVERSPALADIGPFIRAHHERMDGDGYPDRRAGQAIPLEARIVSVCDSFDAMANTRQYRDGMGAERALAILREHAGSQWDTTVVEAAAAVIERSGLTEARPRLDAVGRPDDEDGQDGDYGLVGCDCVPATVSSGATESTQ